MLFAASESAVTKKPRLRLTTRRSSSVSPFGILPQRDVAAHLDFLRHPVVRARGEILLPRPLVLERDELIDVGLAVDDALVGDVDAPVTARSATGSARSAGKAIAAQLRTTADCGPTRRPALRDLFFKLQHVRAFSDV